MAVTELQKLVTNPACERERTYWVRSTAEASSVMDQVGEAMVMAGYTEKDCFGMRQALEEAVANAVKHGHHGDPTKRVRVRYYVKPECVLAEVEDQGDGFDRASVPDPLAPENLERDSGRGLLLMRSLLTWCHFNRKGNCVTLCKARSDA